MAQSTTWNQTHPKEQKRISIKNSDWKWILAFGIFEVIVGMAALFMPIATSLAADLVIAVAFFSIGVLMFIQAFRVKHFGYKALDVLLAFFYAMAGTYLFFFPFHGLFALTLFLGIFFAVAGVARIIIAFKAPDKSRVFWYGLSGIVSLILAALVLFGLPTISFWFLGLLVGVDLLFVGLQTINTAFFLKNHHHPLRPTGNQAG